MLTGNWMTDRLDARRFRLGRPQTLSVFGNPENLPAHIIDNLERAKRDRGPFGLRASVQGWVETLSSPTADGTQILNTVTETIMVPDFTLPANYMVQGPDAEIHAVLRHVDGDHDAGDGDVEAAVGRRRGDDPGDLGGVRSGSDGGLDEPVGLCGVVPRRAGCSVGVGVVVHDGPLLARGPRRCVCDVAAGNLNMHVIPASAPAAVNIATNAANAITPTCTFSVSTATSQLTNHIAVLESLN
jgi:hypothetical protein